MTAAVEAKAIIAPQAEQPMPEAEPVMTLVKTVPSEKEARHSIAAFFKAVSTGQTETAAQHLDTMANFAQHSKNSNAVKDMLLTFGKAAAGIEGNREQTTAERGYAVTTPLKQQLMTFDKK